MSTTTGSSGVFNAVHIAVMGEDRELEAALEAALERPPLRGRVSPLAFRPESIPIVGRLGAQIVIVCGGRQPAEARALLSRLSIDLPDVVRILLADRMDREASAHLVLVQPYDVDELSDILDVARCTWVSLANTG